MALIAQEATYRGKIIDSGLSESTNGFPQEILKLQSVEVYDSEGQQWLPADSENNEITWYGVLFDGKNKETLNSKQLKKVTGWTGASFEELAGMDLTDAPIQFRVEPHTYQENTTLQVTWIDVYDAVPGKTIQKLDKAGVQALQQRYAATLASTKTPVKAVSAPAASGTVASAPKTVPPQAPITGDKGTAPATKGRGRPKGKPAIPGRPATATPAGKCTPDEAWDACFSLKRDDITEERLTEIWSEEVYKINADPDKLTPEQWFVVKTNVQKLTSKI